MQRRAFLAAASCVGASAPTAASALGSTFASDWGPAPRRGRPAPLPAGYALMGQRTGVPAMVLYGVALQESMKLWGNDALPWPWTLNVQGAPERYPTYQAAVAAMRRHIAAGIRNVDAGLMQVNWGWHKAKLVEPARALDPYPNIAVGAQILREHYAATRDWYQAVGRYHSPGNAARASNYAALVYRRISQVPQPGLSPAAARLGGARG